MSESMSGTGMNQRLLEQQRLQGIKRARAMQRKEKISEQKAQHMQKVAGNVDKGRVSAPKTDAQKKQALKQKRSFLANKRRELKKNKIKKKLIKKYTKNLKRYERISWPLLYGAAGSSVIGGLLTEIYIGYLFVIPAVLYIDVTIWRSFDKLERKELRLKMVGASAIKVIPIIGMVPASIWFVYEAKKKAEKEKKKNQKKIKRLTK